MAPSEPKKEKKERTLTGLHVRKNLRRMASGGSSRKDEEAANEDLLRADRAEAAAAAADAWLCEARLAHGREVAARAAADCDNRDALDRAEAATVAATAALELERRRACVLADEKRVHYKPQRLDVISNRRRRCRRTRLDQARICKAAQLPVLVLLLSARS